MLHVPCSPLTISLSLPPSVCCQDVRFQLRQLRPTDMVEEDKRKGEKENLDKIDRWIESKKCLSRAYFLPPCLPNLLALPSTRFNPHSRVLQQKILYYNLFEMPIKYRIEFAVNRQAPKEVRRRRFLCLPLLFHGRQFKMRYANLSDHRICRWRRQTKEGRQARAKHCCWLYSNSNQYSTTSTGAECSRDRRTAQEWREEGEESLLFLSDIADPARKIS